MWVYYIVRHFSAIYSGYCHNKCLKSKFWIMLKSSCRRCNGGDTWCWNTQIVHRIQKLSIHNSGAKKKKKKFCSTCKLNCHYFCVAVRWVTLSCWNVIARNNDYRLSHGHFRKNDCVRKPVNVFNPAAKPTAQRASASVSADETST